MNLEIHEFSNHQKMIEETRRLKKRLLKKKLSLMIMELSKLMAIYSSITGGASRVQRSILCTDWHKIVTSAGVSISLRGRSLVLGAVMKIFDSQTFTRTHSGSSRENSPRCWKTAFELPSRFITDRNVHNKCEHWTTYMYVVCIPNFDDCAGTEKDTSCPTGRPLSHVLQGPET